VLAEAINFCRLGQVALRTTVAPSAPLPLQKAALGK
jgi:hypothetical protein